MVINILKYKYCVGKSRAMSSDHFFLKLVTGSEKKSSTLFIFYLTLHVWNDCPSHFNKKL